MTRRLFSRAILATAVAAWCVGAVSPGALQAAEWGENYFPNLPVVTHKGESLRFYDDLVRDKIVAIDFIYTNCPDICSLTTARMAKVVKLLGDRVGRDVFVYSISLDPDNDSVDALAEYAKAFDAPEGWLFLTGKPEDLHQIRWKLGERSRSLSEHRSDMVLGNDRTGSWRRISAMGNLGIVARSIMDMDPAWRARQQAASRPAAPTKTRRDYRLGDVPGEALFLKACSACHSIGRGDRVGPDLDGVMARRDRDWLVRYLMAPDRLRAASDAIALQLDARYAGVRMPNLGLSEADAKDILTYLESRMDTVSQMEEVQ